MLFRNPQAFAAILMIAGTSLLVYFGEQWYRLPPWSEAEIEQSVELNLAMDLQRLGPHLRPTGEKLERLRQLVRGEVEGQINRERHDLERWIGAGLLLAVLGLGQWAAVSRRK